MKNMIVISYKKEGKEIDLALDKSRIILVEREENKVYISLDIEQKGHYLTFKDSEIAKKEFIRLTSLD